MKAIVYTQYGSPDVLRLEEVEKPAPKDGEVLVQVHAASANASDWHLLRGDPFLARLFAGLTKPKFPILGADVAGRIEAVGANVKQLQPGDAVFGNLASCGFGAFAEYVAVPASALVLKPANVSFEEAAAVPQAAMTALQALRNKGRIQAGQKVLINGASGGVGTFAVQLAKSFEAEVTAVCSTAKVDMMRELGADHVIDYTQEDFLESGGPYDLILAANGYRPIREYRRALSPKGVYVMIGGSTAQMFEAILLGPLLSMTGSQELGYLLMDANQEDLAFIAGLLESGTIAPVIDRHYPLDEVPEAIRYLEEGHARGKVVITVAAPHTA